MNSPQPSPLRAHDSVAIAMEEHIRRLQAEGHGTLAVERQMDGISLAFGDVRIWAENYDIALVRMASALLDDAYLGTHFLKRLCSAGLSARLRDGQS